MANQMSDRQRQELAKRRKIAQQKKIAKRKKAIRIRLLMLSMIALIILVVVLVFRIGKNGEIAEEKAKSLTEVITEKYFAGRSDIYADLTKYYIYSTNFNLAGSWKITGDTNVDDLELVFVDIDGKETTFNLDYEEEAGVMSFALAEEINDGIFLDGVAQGTYCIMLKVSYVDDSFKYFTLQNQTEYNENVYYTVTKDNNNNKIEICFTQDSSGDKNISFFTMDVAECELPEDVYDIVIDPGHGGTDPGAVNGGYYEADIVVDYALDLKEELESKGYKVKLTRDGTESDDEDLVYNVYDEDGRVNVTCASGAKYCFSLHLNSNDAVTSGGVEVFASSNADLNLARLLAEDIVEYADTSYSNMETYKVEDGVYIRNFTSAAISQMKSEAREDGYEPYDVTETTPYLYMIRETGGIITGAISDGRNEKFAQNQFYKSNRGVETYVLEMGYLSVEKDLDNLLDNKKGYVKGISTAIEEYLQNK